MINTRCVLPNIMWICRKCKHSNSNSSKTCHGKKCDGIREKDEIKKPVELRKEKPRKRVYDFCPVHGKDVIWVQGRWHKKNVWRCTVGGHKPAILIGKSKPFPLELMTPEERKAYDSKLKKKIMTIPDADTGDGAL